MSEHQRWRNGLLVAILVGSVGGYTWMYLRADALRSSLLLLTAVFVAGTGLLWLSRRHQMKRHLLTANLALGAIVHTLVAGLIVAGERLGALGLFPAVAQNWHHFAVGGIGVAAAFFTWSRARGAREATPTRSLSPEVEPAPPASPVLVAQPDWEARGAELEARGDVVRLRHLQALHRLEGLLLNAQISEEERADQVARALRQEVLRLAAESAAEERESLEDDVLSQAASLLEWGAQKVPELAELDVSDVLMGKAIADIRATASSIEQIFVDHRELVAIHPIDRQTAEDKCEERAAAARAALPVLEANGMRLSEELIGSEPSLEAFRSVTGFQVVQLLDGGYVTFEGNGRREAIQRAFGDDRAVQVEVRLYKFDDPEQARTIDRRVRRVRRWKGLEAP